MRLYANLPTIQGYSFDFIKNAPPTHHRILEMIGEWNLSLAQNSRYKDDFKHVNDMFRLLQYKGYKFPETSKDIFLLPPMTLQTEDQLEAEDRENQGAVFALYNLET